MMNFPVINSSSTDEFTLRAMVLGHPVQPSNPVNSAQVVGNVAPDTHLGETAYQPDAPMGVLREVPVKRSPRNRDTYGSLWKTICY